MNPTVISVLVGGATVLAALPFVVYLSVKLGVYAFYHARELYQKDVLRRTQE